RNPAAKTRRATWTLQKTRLSNQRGESIRRSFGSFRELSFALLDHAGNLLQIFVPQMARFDEMDEERFRRAIKNTIDKFADHGGDDVIVGLCGAVKEGVILEALLEIALGFEDLHHGHDGGVSDFAALEKGFINIADGGGAALPDELHD